MFRLVICTALWCLPGTWKFAGPTAVLAVLSAGNVLHEFKVHCNDYRKFLCLLSFTGCFCRAQVTFREGQLTHRLRINTVVRSSAGTPDKESLVKEDVGKPVISEQVSYWFELESFFWQYLCW